MSSDITSSVAAWRGQCLNHFSRAEQTIGQSLEVAVEAGKARKLRHLAGQRLADLLELFDRVEATDKQKRALSEAVETWKLVEPKRQFLAHGVELISTNDDGTWTLLLDVVIYRSARINPQRWAIRQHEANEFLGELAKSFAMLSCQLAQFRSRLSETI